MSVQTPWGRSDSSTKLVKGITFYSTPSHGGYRIAPALNDTIHPALRKANGWYEEDCDWARVALAFPDLFTADKLRHAHSTMKDYAPNDYELWYRHTKKDPFYEIPLEESHTKRRAKFAEDHVNDYVAVAAFGSWHEKVPKGMVGVFCVRGGRKADYHYASNDEKYFLVPTEEYENDRTSSTFGFVVDTSRHQEIEKL